MIQANWKKPWTVLLWVITGDEYIPEEGSGPERTSRFGPGGFWKWLFASEEFIEEPEMAEKEPRFGDRGFFSWLFLPDKRGLLEDETGFERSESQTDKREDST